MFKVILAATDGSAPGTRAVEAAASLAGKYRARLVVLSVVEPGPLPQDLIDFVHKDRPSLPHPLLSRVPSWFDSAVEAAQRSTGEAHTFVEALAREALNHAATVANREGVGDHATFLEHGDAQEKIIECANRENADLVVLGRGGLNGVAEKALGGLYRDAVHFTERTCLTVR